MKTSTKKLLVILGIVFGVVAVAAIILGGVLVAKYFSMMGDRGNDYTAIIQTLESAKKSFVAGEVAEIGPYDITASAQKEYKPSQEDLGTIEKQLNRNNNTYNLAGESGQFVLVTLNVKYNQTRSAYDSLSTSSKDWARELSNLGLNDMRALTITPDIDDYQTSKAFIADAKSSEGVTLSLLYRLPKVVEAYTLNYDISIFTKVSPIVGTEGMPRKTFEYTIGIQ